MVSLLLMGIWIEYEELCNTSGGPLAENSPANSAVGIILLVLGLSALLYRLRRPLRLASPELVVIYSALILAAPIMSQGFWHRMFGLLAAIPHNADFKSYESLPPMLWPHGPNLVDNGRFEAGLQGWQQEGARVDWQPVEWQGRTWRVPVLAAAIPDGPPARLTFTLPRNAVVPGEQFLVSCLVKASGFTGSSTYTLALQADEATPVPIVTGTEATRPTFALPSGLQRVGACPVTIPPSLTNRLTLCISLRGQGTLAIHDVQCINAEAVEGLYTGRHVVRASALPSLGSHERNFTLVKPDTMLSLAGARYLLAGGIPIRPWLRPLAAWSALVAALFAGFMGLNLLMRKQWVEHERFTFPLTLLPKRLFQDEDGRWVIFRNRVAWAGAAVTFPLVIWKGLCFYYPSLPAIGGPPSNLDTYFTSPVLKAFFSEFGSGGLGLGMAFCLLAVTLLIETDVLFSLWLTFFVFQLWRAFGKAFNFTRFPGYPWEHQQGMGAFIAFALLALFVGRHHLVRVFGLIIGRATPPEHRAEAQTYRGGLLLVLASLVTIGVWSVWTRMGITAGLLFFGYMLVCGFAASKIRAEMGAPFGYITPYYGMQFVAAMGGFAVVQATGMLVATIAAGFMCTACFLLIAPAQVEMMELGRHFNVRPRDIGAGLTLGLLGGLLIGGFVVLSWAYGFGANTLKNAWPYEQNWYFNGFRTDSLNADRALESGTLGHAPESQALNVMANPNAKGLAIGAGITAALAGLRALFSGFPLHPLGYVLASTFFMKGMWFYILLAWVIRLVLFRLGGARTIREGLVPFCVGMFLAAVVSIPVFDVVGIILRLHGVTSVYGGIP